MTLKSTNPEINKIVNDAIEVIEHSKPSPTRAASLVAIESMIQEIERLEAFREAMTMVIAKHLK